MKWRGRRQSSNVVDRRSTPSGGGSSMGSGSRSPLDGMLRGGGSSRGGGGLGGMGGLGIVGAIIAVIAALFFGGGDLLTGGGGTTTTTSDTRGVTTGDDAGQFVATVLAETEDTWNAAFRASGLTYEEPVLVLFTGETGTGCGFATAATGPFYCPADRRIYIDLSFYDTLERGLGAGGDFAQAYVIAHEVAHHVQNLLGIFSQAAAQANELDANAHSIRVELQADCYAGVWGNQARALGLLDPGDIEEALNAAARIGDDAIQQRTQGYVRPETFTHGTSAQRVRWFRRGFDTGDPTVCDTFAATTL